MNTGCRLVALLSVAMLIGCSDNIAAPQQPVNELTVAGTQETVSVFDAALIAAVVDDAVERVLPALANEEDSGAVKSGFTALARALSDGDVAGVHALTLELARSLDVYRAGENEEADVAVLRLVLDLAKRATAPGEGQAKME